MKTDNIEAPRVGTSLNKYFHYIKEKPNIQPQESEFSDIFDDPKYREYCFNQAKASFKFVFNKELIKSHLNKSANKESLKYLKEIRRYGIILKGVYKFTGDTYKCSDNLKSFLYNLGQYNDTYWISSDKEKSKKVLDSLDDLVPSINFATTESFREYANKVMSKIDFLVRQQKLNVKQFHDLRKKLRSFADLFQIPASEDLEGKMHWLFSSMIRISFDLGKYHNELVKEKLESNTNLDGKEIILNNNIIEEFAELRPFIVRVCGLDGNQKL
ncbi:MAG: hypothetical protein K9L98_00830 [Candidatus Pacebacteria bacterium]|nr:hypothetical protein [Candidatus Paceibacterota bacterium]MCF7862540.1 hypothetical protein [Candidatus Paceibacterota bacterium]